ncbi:MAG: bifunctional metallophosphatase/5'-nucleotidase, partial [Victivallales bacterium]|nr:bifunctional metallophosphatase/5'-nucleotidase [Victivallales bacterium]
LDVVQSDLMILHINDQRSFLLNGGCGLENFGGAARMATLFDELRKQSDADVSGTPFMTLSSGGSFQPGQIFDMSLKKGIPYFDAMAMDIMGFDAVLIADRDFALGPDILANFIGSFKLTRPVFISANLDVSAEPKLLSLQRAGLISKSTIVQRGRRRFGIVGFTSPDLARLYSPGKVVIDTDIVAAVQREVGRLKNYGVDKTVLLADFKNLAEDLKTIGQLRNIDIVVSGGGMELLADRNTPMALSGKHAAPNPFGSYPILAVDADQKIVPVVTTPGHFLYAGFLHVNFDSKNLMSHISRRSGLFRVIDEQTEEPDASSPDQTIQKEIILPIAKTLSTYSAIIADSQVPLDGNPKHLQTRETNLGTLSADAVLWAANKVSKRFDTSSPDIAMINAGAISGSIASGKVSEADVFRISSFSHFISIAENVSPEDFKKLVESTLSKLASDSLDSSGTTSTGFPQFSNCSVVYNPARPPGSRIKDLRTSSGALIVKGYKLVDLAPATSIATLDFLARGAEGWDFGGNRIVNLGIPLPSAINSFVTAPESDGGLGKAVSAQKYKPDAGNAIFVTRE